MTKIPEWLVLTFLWLFQVHVTESVNIVVGDDPNKFPLRWTDGACYLPIKNVRVGDTIEFQYGGHNVYKMKSVQAFNDCDFSKDNADLLSGAYESPYIYTVTEEDAKPPSTEEIEELGIVGSTTGITRSLYFACSVGAHCNGQQKLRVDVEVDANIDTTAVATSRAGTRGGDSASATRSNSKKIDPVSEFVLGADADTCTRVQNGEDVEILNRFMESECSEPERRLEDYGREVWFRSCLSPPVTMTPGGVVNQAILMKYPFPVDRRVLMGRRIWEFMQGDLEDLRPVYVNQLYVHHIIGGIVMGNGAESIRRVDEDAPFPPPYGKLSGDFNDRMVFHLIDIRETGDDWLECVECRCKDANGTYLGFGGSGGDGRLANETGGIDCCSNCTDLTTPTVDYRLRYNVSWSEIEEAETVRPIIDLTADIALALNTSIEFDVPEYELLPTSQRLPDDPTVQVLERKGRFKDLFRQGFLTRGNGVPNQIEVHRCTGHMHISALGMWLENAETGEVICYNNVTYGNDANRNKGFLTSVGTQNFDPPIIIKKNTKVKIKTHYNATELHTGVMGLWFLFVADHEAGGHVEVGTREAALTVELCSSDRCDMSMVPSMDDVVFCEDKLQEGYMCNVMGICECEDFLEMDEVTGCGGVFMTPSGANFSVDFFCAKHCGCIGFDDEEKQNKIARDSLREQFYGLYDKWCRYASEQCQKYLSNLYTCADRWEEFNIDPFVRDVIFKEGTKTVLERAKLGDEAMHRFDTELTSTNQKLLPCSASFYDEDIIVEESIRGERILYIVGFLFILILLVAFWAYGRF